jgi:hypothetical protein
LLAPALLPTEAFLRAAQRMQVTHGTCLAVFMTCCPLAGYPI